MTPAWRVWIGVSIAVALVTAFLAIGLFGEYEGAVLMFGVGVWWDASTPTALRAINRRLAR